MKRLLMLSFALFLTTIITACNTVEGAGQDMQKAGSAVSEEAREHK